jgi:hypothetical protein
MRILRIRIPDTGCLHKKRMFSRLAPTQKASLAFAKLQLQADMQL